MVDQKLFFQLGFGGPSSASSTTSASSQTDAQPIPNVATGIQQFTQTPQVQSQNVDTLAVVQVAPPPPSTVQSFGPSIPGTM